ncbi:GntR family transcriptional regulator [Alkaliphilus peptidifermentans]|uniref:GntR family transcriptional regulator, frlABCD operon transcriptional regulator n=1 Tax=Alkaliphilus peptidifermentans DSM 18978 TaxID=1120976 RepID=A0A1G5HQN2_9FIRM|nr:GntR family transcriptional regulator [Alkaliphilus peptidifermentans]SCY66192.1 GntR family transcriptional regulator, frlABCD operon transcriptional regulator [Alkaliphilus peptidifermentans DSM 18978]
MLEQQSSVALYEQLKAIIKGNIVNGTYKVGDKLPNETELCEAYDVSRITVRRALKELSNEGLIEIKQGKGTFVAKQKLSIQIIDLGGYTNRLSNDHNKIVSKVLEKKIISADNEVAKAFQMDNGFKVLRLKRLILDDEAPLSIDISYFPIDVYPNIIDKITDGVSTFNIIRNDYGIVMAKAYKEFNVLTDQYDFKKLLKCSPTEPLFGIKKIIYDNKNRPIHYSTYYIIANNVKYFINVDIPQDKS